MKYSQAHSFTCYLLLLSPIMPALSSYNKDCMCQQSLAFYRESLPILPQNNTKVIMTQFDFPLINPKGKWFHKAPTLREISVKALRTTCLNTEAGLGKIPPRNRNLIYHLFSSGLQNLNMEAWCWLKRNQTLYPTTTKMPTMMTKQKQNQGFPGAQW